MKLTKTLTFELRKAVLVDQLTPVFNKAQQEINTLLKAYGDSQTMYDYDKIAKAVFDAGGHISMLRSTKSIGFSCYAAAQRQVAIYPEASNRAYHFKFKTVVEADKPIFTIEQYSDLISPSQKIENACGSVMEAFDHEVKNLTSDLDDVLYAAQTVEKLQELTAIFDPFIPTRQTGSTLAIVPAEALCRLNERKSPVTKIKETA